MTIFMFVLPVITTFLLIIYITIFNTKFFIIHWIAYDVYQRDKQLNLKTYNQKFIDGYLTFKKYASIKIKERSILNWSFHASNLSVILAEIFMFIFVNERELWNYKLGTAGTLICCLILTYFAYLVWYMSSKSKYLKIMLNYFDLKIKSIMVSADVEVFDAIYKNNSLKPINYIPIPTNSMHQNTEILNTYHFKKIFNQNNDAYLVYYFFVANMHFVHSDSYYLYYKGLYADYANFYN
ncbi:hypothetical protein BCF59_0154 [Mycoplasmopsis mustelae]|uniref:Uncharacterized protein n=1 Tax=Mycoplasmopsis mustelae TaxID=171289 RepID=A0A4R7UEY0_9BACT|nr:hypothetical protein [Mycoplasmopsis mustelae]TDV24204.1 hypothetical protein BCF59_0154 [Mycoplasmopsis mustelae]